MPPRVVWIHPEAPPKPDAGAPCNGCGLCCLAEPCPIGVLVTRRTRGPCTALEWSPTAARYECGMLTHPTRHLGVPGLRRLAPHSLLNRLLRRWSSRMIAAGIGCDADLTVTPSAPAPPASSPATPPASKDNR